jgi:hypothetical protein
MRSFALLLLLICAAQARAQFTNILPGSRVRIDSRSFPQRLEGTVMAHSGDSVVVATSGVVRTAVPGPSIYRVQASQGKSHMAGAIKGAKIGAIVSGGMGLLLGLAFADATDDATTSDVIAVAAVYAGSGALWGGAIGGVVGAEKWSTVYSQPYRLSAGVTRSGAPAVGISLAF